VDIAVPLVEMNLQPIGFVRSPVRERKSMPPLGVPAAIDILPEYAAGLHRIGKHSHVWVLAWLHHAQRDVLQVTPRGVTDPGPGGLHGIFAVRSPVRPNPIGLTAARLVRVSGTRLEVDSLDFLDGTPVIDLKPYFVSKDLILAANNAQIGRPASTGAMRDSLIRQAVNFHGEWCGEVSLAVRILQHFRSEVLQLVEPEPWRIHVPLHRPCLIDAVMGMTRATPGRGSLFFHNEECLLFHHQDAEFRYQLLPVPGIEPDAILQAADQALFEFARVN
jgi:tRNA-Thr(GGU) m(6)t(6)A37 methyltransferase TsaA